MASWGQFPGQGAVWGLGCRFFGDGTEVPMAVAQQPQLLMVKSTFLDQEATAGGFSS